MGLDILCPEERGEILSALDCDPECLAECPTTRCFGGRGGCPTVSRGGTSPGPPIPGLQGPVSSPGASRWRCSPSLILCVPGHGHRPAHSPEDLNSVVGGASWSGACRLFSGGEPPMCNSRTDAVCRSPTKSPCWGMQSRQCIRQNRSRRH